MRLPDAKHACRTTPRFDTAQPGKESCHTHVHFQYVAAQTHGRQVVYLPSKLNFNYHAPLFSLEHATQLEFTVLTMISDYLPNKVTSIAW